MATKTRTAEIAAARAADEKIAAAWDLYWAAQAPVDALRKEIRSCEKMVRYYGPGRRADEYKERIAKYTAQAEEKQAAAELLRRAASALDKELYKGWSRFFLVQHIHSSQHCSSFRPTTRIGWLPSVSGLTEAEAVKEHGATLCTICFPSAPTELTTKPVDDKVCAGSGKVVNHKLPNRMGFYSGNWGTCEDCGQRVTITGQMGYKLRKHNK